MSEDKQEKFQDRNFLAMGSDRLWEKPVCMGARPVFVYEDFGPQMVGWLHGTGCCHNGRFSPIKEPAIPFHPQPIRQIPAISRSEGWDGGVCLEDHLRYESLLANTDLRPPRLDRDRRTWSIVEENRPRNSISPTSIDVPDLEWEEAVRYIGNELFN